MKNIKNPFHFKSHDSEYVKMGKYLFGLFVTLLRKHSGSYLPLQKV